MKLVFLTMNEDADLAAEAFRAGASAYLLKRSAVGIAGGDSRVMQGRSSSRAGRGRSGGISHGPLLISGTGSEVLQLRAEGR